MACARIVVVLACVGGLVWMFSGPEASGRVVGNANVVAAVLAVVVAVVAWWPWGRRRSAAEVQGGQVQAAVEDAVEYLAGNTLRYWRAQAKDRRITTPSPADANSSPAGRSRHRGALISTLAQCVACGRCPAPRVTPRG